MGLYVWYNGYYLVFKPVEKIFKGLLVSGHSYLESVYLVIHGVIFGVGLNMVWGNGGIIFRHVPRFWVEQSCQKKHHIRTSRN